ncbi:MAG: M10 family metallopeptidase C-terminal domain-containing protein [Rickettsiales bacterium]|nr:M10 family metallopeptidase C-terminal domain-containing protein [Rickettsiales bacterium]
MTENSQTLDPNSPINYSLELLKVGHGILAGTALKTPLGAVAMITNDAILNVGISTTAQGKSFDKATVEYIGGLASGAVCTITGAGTLGAGACSYVGGILAGKMYDDFAKLNNYNNFEDYRNDYYKNNTAPTFEEILNTYKVLDTIQDGDYAYVNSPISGERLFTKVNGKLHEVEGPIPSPDNSILNSFSVYNSGIQVGKVGNESLNIMVENDKAIVKVFDKVESNDVSSIAIETAKVGVRKISIIGDQGTEISSHEVKEGDKSGIFYNSGLLKEELKFLDSNGNEVFENDAIIKFEDTELGELTVIRSDVSATLADGSTSTLDEIVSTIDSAAQAIPKFVLGAIDFGEDLISSIGDIFDNERIQLQDQQGNLIYLDENGDQTIEQYHYVTDEEGNVVQEENEKATGPSNLDLLLADFAARVATGEDIDNAAIETAKTAIVRSIAKDLSQNVGINDSQIQGGVAAAVARIGMMHINGEDPDSQDYAMAAMEGVLLFYGVNPAIVSGVVTAVDKILEEDGKLNSDGYRDVAAVAVTTAVVATVSIKVGAAVGTVIGGPVGTVVGAVVGAIVGYLIAVPLYNGIISAYEAHEQMYDAIEDIFKGDDIDDQLKEFLKGYEDYVKALTIDFAKDIGRGAIQLLTGSYGIEYAAGEYPTPYSYIKVIPKEDGSGNNIIGIEPEGVVAIAREYYHDDLYGNSGSDNLIGKSGTNTIYGYGGNDHIEGRGDIDLLVGGDGNDDIYAGNGDDQVYGGSGNDNLFGGAGNDTIVGGTGDDYAQGGFDDDQIMGEEGNDILKGDAGNDIMLGGSGSDVIEGGVGDDSLLGEDGDDIILGEDGSDVIDGGIGEDIIYGGAGNDNIRGGDDNDEIYGGNGVDIIYGDSGDDIINSGADNDLVFGGISNDIIYGGEGDDSLYGEIGNDYVIGGSGADIVDGGVGDDILLGGIGSDTITFGIGNDTYIFRSGDGQDVIDESQTILDYGIEEVGNNIIRLSEISSKTDNDLDRLNLTKDGDNLVIEFLDDEGNATTDKITINSQFESSEIVKTIEFSDGYKIDLTNVIVNGDDTISYVLETYSNIDTAIQEELVLGYNDQMEVSEEQANPESTYNANNYNSSAEQDSIDFEKYNEMQWRSYKKKRSSFGGHYTVWYKYYEGNLYGTNGNDRVVGHWWSENIYGGVGDDQLHGGDGNDTLYGGAGDDILHGGPGIDNVYGEAGEDLIYGGTENDNLYGGDDNDTIYGNSGNDKIDGGSGDDKLEGNQGGDIITDESGNNIVIGGSGNDNITTNNGNNRIEGNDGADTIDVKSGNNLIYGNEGNDFITAADGNDTIYGQEGFDLINSGAGDDYISGGSGDDILNGEDGNDTIYGDVGIDAISGGAGVDYIYGGAGADIILGGEGNDVIKGGSDDDKIEGGLGDDTIYGNSGSDVIYGDEGDDVIDGGIEGDVLEGGLGDDIILGGQGNDILVDGAGSDILDGGLDSDIIILTKESSESTSVDTVRNFNISEDKIILKVDYKNPITFSDIQDNLKQDGDNAKITLDNGQTIVIENIDISDITSSIFQIGLSGGADNDILFGTDGEDIVFGDEGDDKIYGGQENDELWGGRGSDELYGQEGDDILRYEADGNYIHNEIKTYFDEIGYYYGYSHHYVHPAHYFNYDKYFIFKPNSEYKTLGYSGNDDVVISGYDLINRGESSRYHVSVANSEAKNHSSGHPWVFGFRSNNVLRINFDFESVYKYQAKNFYNSTLTDVTGYNRTFDKFDGGEGSADTILMTEGNDVLTLDDPTSASGGDEAGTATEARVKDISVIHAGAGDDVINFSTEKYSYGDVVVYGGEGNDKIWLNEGDDQVFGGEGNDEVYSGIGEDKINGGDGDDNLYGGEGDDVIDGGSGTNNLFGEAGNDVFITGEGSDIIDGGLGSDTVSYVNSLEAVNIDLSTNEISGGDADNDSIVNIENVIGSSFDDILVGNDLDNSFTGRSGDDSLSGGLGSDIYIYDFNGGIDIVTESGGDVDSLHFSTSISSADLNYSRNGDNLEIQVGSDSSNKVILTNQYLSEGKIEKISFEDDAAIIALSSSSAYTITDKFYISNEDEELVLEDISFDENTRIAISALYGIITLDAEIGKYKYRSNNNFFGIDEILIEELDEEDQVISNTRNTIFVNSINDAPIGDIKDFEVKVEEGFSINLSDYFDDVDGDDLSYEISLKGFSLLPNWIKLDKENNILSGTPGRDGKLQFTITASDKYGSYVEDDFRINITRNIIDDIIPKAEIKQVMGTDSNDVLQAVENSADIIVAGAGDDTINYMQDEIWQEYSNFTYNAWNIYSGDEISVTGKTRSFDAFDGGDGYDTLNLTKEGDVMFLDDAIVSNLGDIAKISGIEEINAGAGDDIIDLTSLNFTYLDVVLNGQEGDDVLWSSDGDDTLNGGQGDDNLQSGLGNDTINGGEGNDIIKAYDGDDIMNGGSGSDIIIGGEGNDQFIYSFLSDSTDNNIDVILDFIQNEDSIDLSALNFESISKGKGSATNDTTLEYYFDEEGNTIIDDPNSSFAIKLSNEIELTGSDFAF